MGGLYGRDVKDEQKQNPWPRSARTIPIMLYDEFLVAEELRGLLDYSIRNASSFVQSEVVGYGDTSEQDRQHRRSRVLFELGPYGGMFRRRLLTFLPHVLHALGKRPFHVVDLEMQLTASNHAEFFRAHTDTGDNELRGRELTFVYFFHREPRRFAGGELRIFDTETTQDVPTATHRFQLVYPLQNQVVFFPSSFLHEILPVICPSREFADSRFTVNGWYRQ
jgi:Rps23 Pro-64 3,4-dihydroxylase Tpa1-like proline 4-hydroxylase